MPPNDLLRKLPSVNDLLTSGAADLVRIEGHPRTVIALREAIDIARAAVLAGKTPPTGAELIAIAAKAMARADISVINATGVIIHTNLGRATLSAGAIAEMTAVARNYTALEFDLDSGARGRRGAALETLLCELTGAGAALVVNNGAAAAVLMLAAHAAGRGVVVARGQLVEIGGGFRVPDIMLQSARA